MTPSKKVLAAAYALFFLLLLLFVEAMSFFAVRYLSGRGVFFDKTIIKQNYAEYLRRRDPLLGWRPLANAVDSFGARKDFSAYSDSAPCLDVYGDSYTWGYEVSDREAWPALLSDELKCRVRNFGVPGYGTDQAYMRFLNATEHSPIVFLDHWSENIIRNVNQFRNFIYPSREFAFKPRFILRNGLLSSVPVPSVPEAALQAFFDKPQAVLHDEYFIPDSASGPSTAFFPYTWSLLTAYHNWMVQAKLHGRPIYSEFYSSEHPSHALELTTTILNEFHSRALAEGIRPVVMILPTCGDFREYGKRKTFPYEPLVEALEREHVRVLDIGKVIHGRYGDDAQRLYRGCRHFSPDGNRLVAELISEYVKREQLIATAK